MSEREKELLDYLCKEMSYDEISKKVFLSESIVDTYWARLFENFKKTVLTLLKVIHLDPRKFIRFFNIYKLFFCSQ